MNLFRIKASGPVAIMQDGNNEAGPGARPRTRHRTDRKGWFGGLCRCRKGVAALEFALLSTPLLLLTFGSVATCMALHTMAAMQNAAQYSALMVATGAVKNLTTGPISTTNTTSTTQCSGALATTDAEYYACQGLPPWATFTVTTTENCATPSVTVALSVDASAAAVADVFSFFKGSNLTSRAVVMKQGTCP